jgi:hypothetical protein
MNLSCFLFALQKINVFSSANAMVFIDWIFLHVNTHINVGQRVTSGRQESFISFLFLCVLAVPTFLKHIFFYNKSSRSTADFVETRLYVTEIFFVF